MTTIKYKNIEMPEQEVVATLLQNERDIERLQDEKHLLDNNLKKCSEFFKDYLLDVLLIESIESLKDDYEVFGAGDLCEKSIENIIEVYDMISMLKIKVNK